MPDSTSILYDHYKDTHSGLLSAIKKRERTMLYVVLMLAAFGFYAFSPTYSSEALSGFLLSQYGLNTIINFNLLGSIIWFLLLVFSLRYFQVSVFIERQYEYLHVLEDKINKKLGEEVITREGKSYLADYPKFSDWVWLMYTVLFPAILLLVAMCKVVYEWIDTGLTFSWYTTLNTTFFIFLAVTILLYLLKIHASSEQKDVEENVTE